MGDKRIRKRRSANKNSAKQHSDIQSETPDSKKQTNGTPRLNTPNPDWEESGLEDEVMIEDPTDDLYEDAAGRRRRGGKRLSSKSNGDDPSYGRLMGGNGPDARGSLAKDMPNIVLLVVLYLLQGVPLGLVFGSMNFLLKEKLSYADLAIFSLSGYPYSLKLFWSPIVDVYYHPYLGRRKSWIVPIQAITGVALIVLGRRIDGIMAQEEIPVRWLAFVLTVLVFLCATQDIAVDAWALTLLSEENKTYASTAQTIGLNTGYFLSFTVFLALNSKEFCNRYLRSQALDHGLIELGPYLQFWGVAFLLCNLWLIFVTKEEPDELEGLTDIKSVYQTMWNICKAPHMRALIAIMLLGKLGFAANEGVAGLKLLEVGFHKEDLALGVLIDFPLQLMFGYYAARWSSGARPLNPWLYGYAGRMAAGTLGAVLVWVVSKTGPSTTMFFVVLGSIVFRSFAGTVQFVSLGSFFTKISDPTIGGSYMTLLNTISNFGGTWPNYFVLRAVDLFTDATCNIPANATLPDNYDPTVPFRCVDEHSKRICKDTLSGICEVRRDGFYPVSIVSVIIGIMVLYLLVLPNVRWIESLPTKAWRVKRDEGEDDGVETEFVEGKAGLSSVVSHSYKGGRQD
ncbi:acetyl-coenzyme A transporter 1-domain-containing protein [Cladochytrium replicatum]|nr:acetyl-coenzyme A transporter 1-domain-containing protein [Cladochytrium replicatum]